MKEIIFSIRVFFANIIFKIRGIWNLMVNHVYIPDNQRNIQLVEYAIDVMSDPTLEPRTPVEIFFENIVKDDFYNSSRWKELDEDVDKLWVELRPMIYATFATKMLSMKWIKER